MTTACMRDSRRRGRLARAVFDAAEQARVEAIGANAMTGVGDNFAAMLEDKYQKANLAAASSREDAPLEEALALMLREKLTGRQGAASAGKLVEAWRSWVEEKAGGGFGSASAASWTIRAVSPAPCATC